MELIYLLSYSSHVLQPLNLAYFGPIKSKYRKEIADLASLDDCAQIKKIRFISVYAQAREEGLNPHNIRAGWRASGIVPWNPRKVIESSQVHRLADQEAPTAPMQPISRPGEPFLNILYNRK